MAMCCLGVVASSVPSISSPLAARAGMAAGLGCGVRVPLSPTVCFGAAAEALPSPVSSCSSVSSRRARQSEVQGAKLTLLIVFTR